MNPDHAWFIALSYGVTAVAVVAAIVVIAMEHRRLKKALERIGAPADERGEDR